MRIVVRLCTDDKGTVDFYSKIDDALEFPLDVIDDLASEAKEIQKVGNDWFVYSWALHHVRQRGTFCKVLDLLDERKLTVSEVAFVAQLLLRGSIDAPLPREHDAFLKTVPTLAQAAAAVYDVRVNRSVPPVNLDRLRRALGTKSTLGRALGIQSSVTSPFQLLTSLFATPCRRRLVDGGADARNVRRRT